MLSVLSYFYAMYRAHIWWGVGIGICLFGLSTLFKPIIIAIVLSYILNKPITYLEKYHIAKPISALLFISVLVAVFVGFMMIVLPFVNDNMILLSKKIPFFLCYIGDRFNTLSHRVFLRMEPETALKFSHMMQNQMITISQEVFTKILSLIQRSIDITNVVNYFFILPFMIYYMSTDFSKIVHFFGRLLSRAKHQKFQRILRDLDQIFFLYFTGQSLVCVSLMLAYSLSLYLIGIPYALMLGIMVGLLSFIPYVGFMIGFFLITLIAFAQLDPSWTLLGRISSVFFVLSIIETQILSPRIIGKRLGVPPLVFILAIVVVNYYFGLLGMFLAYPITATLIKLWTERWQSAKSYGIRSREKIPTPET